MSDEDVWPDVQRWAEGGRNDVELRPARDEDGERTLEALGVTTRSVLGAFARHAEIGLVDRGWIRLLGAGGPDTACSLLGLGGSEPGLDVEVGLIVAFDVVGGFFAIDGGGLGGTPGEVLYLPPDTLRWEGDGERHGEWVRWALNADLDEYYESLRWPGWEDEVARLAPDQGLHLYPPPWTEEGDSVADVSRRAVPVAELWSVAMQYREQLDLT
jgi:hypothetical protein